MLGSPVHFFPAHECTISKGHLSILFPPRKCLEHFARRDKKKHGEKKMSPEHFVPPLPEGNPPHTYTYTHLYIEMREYIYIYIYMCVCTYVCIYIYIHMMRIYIYIYVCIYIYIYVTTGNGIMQH